MDCTILIALTGSWLSTRMLPCRSLSRAPCFTPSARRMTLSPASLAISEMNSALVEEPPYMAIHFNPRLTPRASAAATYATPIDAACVAGTFLGRRLEGDSKQLSTGFSPIALISTTSSSSLTIVAGKQLSGTSSPCAKDSVH
ncbi:hypothetical protein KCU61_g649, partial [Aureobasidium melanogenum]